MGIGHICTLCGQPVGKCTPVKDAGNFDIPVFNTADGPAHEIPANTPIRIIYKAIIKPGTKIFRICNHPENEQDS